MHMEPLTHAGQIKKGDTLLIESKDGTIQAATAQHIVQPGDAAAHDGEEIVFNKRKNYYFITALYLAGTSWAKEVNILRAGKVKWTDCGCGMGKDCHRATKVITDAG